METVLSVLKYNTSQFVWGANMSTSVRGSPVAPLPGFYPSTSYSIESNGALSQVVFEFVDFYAILSTTSDLATFRNLSTLIYQIFDHGHSPYFHV